MPSRIGVLRVTYDGGAARGDLEGPLSVQEWVLALELVKRQLLEQVVRRTPMQLTGARQVDRQLQD